MRVRGRHVLAIVTAGVGLGAVLGLAADPEPRQPPAPPWSGAPQASYDSDSGYPLADPAPAVPDPYPDRYAPSWADEDLAEGEPDYPAWSYSALPGEPASSDDEPPAEAGQAAAEAAADASMAESPAPEPPPADGLGPLY